jgi:hypothetical protein
MLPSLAAIPLFGWWSERSETRSKHLGYERIEEMGGGIQVDMLALSREIV